MKRIGMIPLVVALLGSGLLPAQEWVSLFDGKTLEGWKAGEAAGSFKVEDGAIVCAGPRSHLFYTGYPDASEFANFELSVEVKSAAGANSGVYFHTQFQAEGWPSQGFEVQVHNARSGQGDYRENKLTGSLYGIRNVYKPLVKDGEWFTLRVTVAGKRVQVRVNEVLVVDYVEPANARRRLGSGTFALQCHDPESRVHYRNLRVKRLPEDFLHTTAPAAPMTDYELEILRLAAANYPVVNYHTHLKGGLTLEEALAVSRQTGVFLGVAVNCGLNFAVTNDAGIDDFLRSMRGQPVFVAMQAEGREWVNLFSQDAIRRFDYVFTDAMTIVDNEGRRMRLWLKDEVPPVADKEAFMEMLVERTVRILETEPIDILVNPTFLPASLAEDYDRLWTEARMRRVAEAAARRKVAIEINSRYRLPSPAFLKLAKAAGCQFTFGTNNADRDIGRLDYCFQMVRELDLKWRDIWVPRLKAGL